MCAKIHAARNFLYHFEYNWVCKQYNTQNKNLQMTQTNNNSKVKLAVENLLLFFENEQVEPLNLDEYETDKLFTGI